MEPTIVIVIAAAVLIVVLVALMSRRHSADVPPAESAAPAVPPELAKPYSNPSGFDDNLADALEKEYRWEQLDRVDDPTWYRKGLEGFDGKSQAGSGGSNGGPKTP